MLTGRQHTLIGKQASSAGKHGPENRWPRTVVIRAIFDAAAGVVTPSFIENAMIHSLLIVGNPRLRD